MMKNQANGCLLQIEYLSKSFGGLMAVNQLALSLEKGQILGIIGPNGSGKTTLFNLVTGFIKPDTGTIKFAGEEISGKRPSYVCKTGISRTFQIVKPFPQLTALENVTAGKSFGRQPSKNLRRARSEAREILEFVGLSTKEQTAAERLNLIDRKRLEIARAVATRPKLLLLDEVFAGLNPAEIEQALELVVKIKNMGMTLMIVEHLMKIILGVSNRVIVLNYGMKIFDGSPPAAMADHNVIEAYLGEDFHA
jgi:branched-chain amino acid transport system ATP-binding protein